MTNPGLIAMTTMTIRPALLALLVLAGCAQPAPSRAQPANAVPGSVFAAAPDAQWRLPERLREISGLASLPDGRLFAHDDEQAVIYEIDVNAGGLVKAFALGAPPQTGDFEGLAISPDGAFWLTDSRGVVYRFREGADGAHVAFERFDTGLGEICEIEGLAYLPAEESLILACKRNHARDMRDTVSLYAWAFSGRAERWRDWPGSAIAAAAGVERFRPSSLDFDTRSGRLVMLSARNAGLVELDADGAILAGRALGAGHPQAEGAAVIPGGALVIADEGRDGRALLSRYPAAHE